MMRSHLRTVFARGLQWGLVGLCSPILLAASMGCGAESAPPDNLLRAAISSGSRDPHLFSVVRVFDVAVLKTTNKSGNPVVCADFPRLYGVGNEQLQLDAFEQLAWNGETGEIVVRDLSVSADEPLLVAVWASAPWGNSSTGEHVVAFGCQTQTFAKNESRTITVDVRASVGAPCTDHDQCQGTLGECKIGPTFPGGYCTTSSCTQNEDCPPGSFCTSDASGLSICARSCAGPTDCQVANAHTCELRAGPDGCHRVCLHPTFGSTACQ